MIQLYYLPLFIVTLSNGLPGDLFEEPDPLWHMFGDRVKLTTFSYKNGTINECNACEHETEFSLNKHLNTSLIDYSLFFDSKLFDIYCKIHEKERNCEEKICLKTIQWSLGNFFCIDNKKLFLKYAPCYALTQDAVDARCHPDCWRNARNMEVNMEMPEGLQQQAIELFNLKAKECQYEKCYLDCQQEIIRSYCSTSEPAVLLRSFVGNRTKIDFQHSEATFAPNCWILVHEETEETTEVGNLHITTPSTVRTRLVTERFKTNVGNTVGEFLKWWLILGFVSIYFLFGVLSKL